MLLTRLGFDSKAVITGDVTQIDLPGDKRSGLVEAIEILTGVEGIGFMEFTRARHRAPPAGAVDHPGLRRAQPWHERRREARLRAGLRRARVSVRLAVPAARAGLPRVDRALLRRRARRILAALDRGRRGALDRAGRRRGDRGAQPALSRPPAPDRRARLLAARGRARRPARRAARRRRDRDRDGGATGARAPAHARRRGRAAARPRRAAPGRLRPPAQRRGAAHARAGAARLAGAARMSRLAWLAGYAATCFLAFPHPVAGRVLDLGSLFAWLAPAALLLGLQRSRRPPRGVARLPGVAGGALRDPALDLHRHRALRARAAHRGRARSRRARELHRRLRARLRRGRGAARARGRRLAVCGRRCSGRRSTTCARSRSRGFPWATLGYAQHQNPALLPLASLGGVYALSFLSVLGGASLARVARLRRLDAAAASGLAGVAAGARGRLRDRGRGAGRSGSAAAPRGGAPGQHRPGRQVEPRVGARARSRSTKPSRAGGRAGSAR